MMMRLYELDAFHKASGHVHRWYLCAGSRGYQSRGTDTPARVTWLPLVGQWDSVAVEAAGAGGGSALRTADLRLMNVRSADTLPRWANVLDVTAATLLRVELGVRPLNALLTDYVIRTIVVKEVDEAEAYSTAVTVWRAKAGLIQPDKTELRLPLWDRLADFDAPLLDPEDCYAGTGGLEGPATLAGMTKERCWGWRPIVAPTYLGVINGRHTYSCNGGHPIEGIVRGWDKAKLYALVTGTPSATNSPAEFAVNTSTGIITIGGGKPEDFRIELKGNKTAGVWHRYIGQIVAHLATTHGGIIDTADVAGIDATPRTAGLYLPAGDTTTHRAAYDKLVGSVARGRWYIDLTDRLIVTRLPRATAATPLRSYRKAAGETDGLRPTAGNSEVPAKQAIVRYAENTTPASETATAATADDAALWTTQWRQAPSAVDTTVAAAWGVSAKPAYLDTALTIAAEAAAEAPLWLEEKADPPRQYELRVRDGAPGLWIGDAIRVTDDIAGFETGATAVIYGRTNRERGGGAILYLER
ncbi:hypothetical protein [Azospirillum picis]|uniref:Tip attachment protein J domain-containing protein n=1 Tax=Azospirillum picis TaxID=488438 RepID=A0ABU0MED3_9PROT|nr:hypothetical protein [Azospirillum picis]MBP2297948.1 hypothetical protein [Azospirillum picis]MDQ0531786.1 hypothetical protein [Azospirillum picis]